MVKFKNLKKPVIVNPDLRMLYDACKSSLDTWYQSGAKTLSKPLEPILDAFSKLKINNEEYNEDLKKTEYEIAFLEWFEHEKLHLPPDVTHVEYRTFVEAKEHLRKCWYYALSYEKTYGKSPESFDN